MTTAEELLVSAEELRRVAAELREQDKLVFAIDGGRVTDRASFVEELRRSVPLDPPLATGRSPNAIADSLFGGLVTAAPAPLLWDKAWVLAEAHAAELSLLLEVLAVVKDQVAAPEPVGGSLNVLVLVAHQQQSLEVESDS